MSVLSVLWTALHDGHIKIHENKRQRDWVSHHSFILHYSHPLSNIPIPRPSPTTDAVSSTSSEGDNLDFEFKISSSRTAHFPDQKNLDDVSQNLGFTNSKYRYFFNDSKNEIC